MKRITLTVETFNAAIAQEAMRSILETTNFDSDSGSGVLQMVLGVTAKWDDKLKGNIDHGAYWTYRVEETE